MNFKSLVLESLERRLLLEYDHDKEWEKHGKEATQIYKNSLFGFTPSDYTPEQDNEYVKDTLKTTLKNTDPSHNQQYHSWMLKTLAKGGFGHERAIEDMTSQGAQALENFHHHKTRNPKLFKELNISNDIGSYKNLRHLQDSVRVLNKAKNPQTGVDISKLDPSEYTHTEHPAFHEYIPHTKKAACELGKNTDWCTASPKLNYFEQYHEEGSLHIIIPKNTKHEGGRYQFHLPSDQFMDERDLEISHHNLKIDHPEIDEHFQNIRDDYENSMEESYDGENIDKHLRSSYKNVRANAFHNVRTNMGDDKALHYILDNVKGRYDCFHGTPLGTRFGEHSNHTPETISKLLSLSSI